jgi:hypothetical protein
VPEARIGAVVQHFEKESFVEAGELHEVAQGEIDFAPYTVPSHAGERRRYAHEHAFEFRGRTLSAPSLHWSPPVSGGSTDELHRTSSFESGYGRVRPLLRGFATLSAVTLKSCG